MADLARLAGVSKITVSRAMGDKAPVSAQTRAKVRALALKHHYTLNVSARNLRLRRSHTVAVVVEMTPTPERPMSDPYPLELLGGILQQLASNDFSALLTTRHGASLPPPGMGVRQWLLQQVRLLGLGELRPAFLPLGRTCGLRR